MGNYSGKETIEGMKLFIIRRFKLQKLFKGGNYSRRQQNTLVSNYTEKMSLVPDD